MKLTNQQYNKYVTNKAPKANLIKNLILSYLIGGLICVLGQIIMNILNYYKIPETPALTSISLIFLGALLTGLNLYDNIAKYGGAGTVVPITGFANAIVSPAMEFKSEGYILGVGAKMFLIAGPVLVYGITTSTLCGIIYFLATK